MFWIKFSYENGHRPCQNSLPGKTSVLYSEEVGSSPTIGTIHCINCSELTFNPKFCSTKCSALFNHKAGKYLKMKKDNCTAKCLFCTVSISNKQKYCSQKCQAEFEYSNTLKEYLSGNYSLALDKLGTIKSFIRKWLREKVENKCSRCGWNKINPKTKKVPVEVEHIDGNHLNNDPSNLDMICPNCHSLTITYKALNMGNGRTSRRKDIT